MTVVARREVWTVYIPPGPLCDAEGCNGIQKADCIWNDTANGCLHLVKICGFHLWALRHRMEQEGATGAMFFPLDCAPPLERVAQEMMREMQRRAQMQRPQYVTMTFGGGYNRTTSFTSAGTGYGGFFR